MGDVGILTFHCADNYGAMLQAYGLKNFLIGKNISADIVPYEPPFMTGRHWWIPYAPIGSVKKILRYGWNGWLNNLKMRGDFFKRREKMKQFRKKYLSSTNQKRVFSIYQLKKLSYQYYIVGSDQIWNPDITCGLRKEYFGAFDSKQKKKVIAYAASLGGMSLSSEYDKKFSEFLQYVNIISVRESAAIPYIRQFYKGEIYPVLDPVFLLEAEEWQKIEKIPAIESYIFVYMTEYNKEMLDYAMELSRKKKLSIVRIGSGADFEGENIIADFVAGPAEFLGYIRKADYIVTNSFHGTAFSIIYQKRFMVFSHSSVGERIHNVLAIHKLEDRIYQRENIMDIDCDIEWDKVIEYTKSNVRCSKNYLLNHIR